MSIVVGKGEEERKNEERERKRSWTEKEQGEERTNLCCSWRKLNLTGLEPGPRS